MYAVYGSNFSKAAGVQPKLQKEAMRMRLQFQKYKA